MAAAKSESSDEVRGNAETNLPSELTERCLYHDDKLVDMYCADHDVVECYICLAFHHKNCSEKFYIPEYIESAKKTLGGNKQGIEQAVTQLSELLNLYTTSKTSLEEAKERCLEEIQDFRHEINRTADAWQESSVNAVEREYEGRNSELTETINKMEKLKKELETRLTNSNASAKSTLQDFVNANKADKLIKESKKIPRPMCQAFHFSRNTDIISLIGSAPSLGEIRQTVKNSDEYDVRISEDSQNSNIWSLCMLDNGDILMGDYSNSKLKLLNGSTYKIKDSLILTSEPMFVSRVNSSKAVVSLTNESLQFIKTADKLQLEKTIKMDHVCSGIAVIKNTVFVADWGTAVYVYSHEWTCLKYFSMDKRNQPLFAKARDLCMSDNGKGVHVTDAVLGLVTLDLEGKLIWKYSGDHLQEAWGVCTDGDGKIFVSGWRSNNVVKISKSGKYLEEVVPASWGLSRPQGLYYDRKHKKLFVSRAPKSSSRVYCFDMNFVETVRKHVPVVHKTGQRK